METRVNYDAEKQVPKTDLGPRLMKTRGITRIVYCCLQTAVDAKKHLIVAHEVINTND
jgi:hypothetical protein